MIKIVADSTADLSEELIKRYDLTILPLHVIMDDHEYLDGVNITPEEIYKWSDEVKKTPKTSAVDLVDTAKVFRELAADGSEIIAFSISASMSTTNNVLRMAADEAGVSDRVSVIDSENLSTGIGLLVLEAADMAKAGMTREEIVTKIEDLIPKVRASFVVDTLVFLARGGRCSSATALLGGVLKLHPRIDVIEGAMQAGQKYRGKLDHVIMQYVKEMEPQLKKAKKTRVFITYSYSETIEEIATEVHKYIDTLHHFDEVLQTHAGAVVSSHCGPGTLGVLFIEGK